MGVRGKEVYPEDEEKKPPGPRPGDGSPASRGGSLSTRFNPVVSLLWHRLRAMRRG